jgi:hypothetical protein
MTFTGASAMIFGLTMLSTSLIFVAAATWWVFKK